jgi:hypothetical protein
VALLTVAKRYRFRSSRRSSLDETGADRIHENGLIVVRGARILGLSHRAAYLNPRIKR